MNIRKICLLTLMVFVTSWAAFASSITVTEDPSAEEVIQKYLEALGGESKLREVKTAKIEMVAEVQGLVINLFFLHDDENNRMNQRVMAMGNEASNVTVKDGKATVSAMGQNMTLTDEQFEEARMNAFIFPELHYGEMGYELINEGTVDVKGEQAHKISVKNATGAKVINYYSLATGLKLKSESSNSGDIMYADYKDHAGIKFPSILTIKSPMIPEEMKSTVEVVDFNVPVSDDDFN